jgi:hypothetical protein
MKSFSACLDVIVAPSERVSPKNGAGSFGVLLLPGSFKTSFADVII